MVKAPKDEVVKLYLAGLSSGQIAKKFDVGPGRILAILRERKVPRRTSKESLIKYDRSKVVKYYNNGYKPSTIAKKLGSCVTTITKILREEVDYKFDPIVYPVQWPSGDLLYYIIGLLLADGNLHIRKRRGKKADGLAAKGKVVSLVLHKNDHNVMEFIRDNLSPTRPISVHNNMSRIDIPVSSDRVKFLNKYGIVERKSLILKPTKILKNLTNDDFLQLFVGYVEGDGSIFNKIVKSGKYSYEMKQLAVYGTFEMLSWFKTRIEEIIQQKTGAVLPRSSIYDYRISGKKAQILGNLCLKTRYHQMFRKWAVFIR